MIKANELRSGNIVYLTKDNFKTQKEYELDAFDIYKLSENDCADIKPIPLTEKWLKKCEFNFKQLGFEDISVSYGMNTGDIHFVIDRYYIKLNYLHQLQNMYFSITGHELIIK